MQASTHRNINVKSMVLTAALIALSFVGSNIKIMGTIAFDSLPGFLAALLLGPLYGAAVGFLGHLFTALTSSFPMTVPIHMVIAVTMAITMLGFGYTYKGLKNKLPIAANLAVTGIVGAVINGPFSLACSMSATAFIAGSEAAWGLLFLLPILTLAAAANIIIAIIVFKALEKVWGRL